MYQATFSRWSDVIGLLAQLQLPVQRRKALVEDTPEPLLLVYGMNMGGSSIEDPECQFIRVVNTLGAIPTSARECLTE